MRLCARFVVGLLFLGLAGGCANPTSTAGSKPSQSNPFAPPARTSPAPSASTDPIAAELSDFVQSYINVWETYMAIAPSPMDEPYRATDEVPDGRGGHMSYGLAALEALDYLTDAHPLANLPAVGLPGLPRTPHTRAFVDQAVVIGQTLQDANTRESKSSLPMLLALRHHPDRRRRSCVERPTRFAGRWRTASKMPSRRTTSSGIDQPGGLAESTSANERVARV